MEPNTIRLQPNTWEALDSEYAEYGFSSRAEYIRHIIAHRDEITGEHEPNTEPNTAEYEAITQRLDELEDTVADLVAGELTADDPDLRGVSTGGDTDSGRRERTAEAVDDQGADRLDAALDAVATLSWGDDTRGDPEEYREVLRAVVRAIGAADDGLAKSELQERVYPDHDAGFDKETWWKNLVWLKLKELRDEHGVVHTEGGGKYTTWHLDG